MDYKPAYYTTSVDYLEEPVCLLPGDTPLGLLRTDPGVESLLARLRDEYLLHIRRKASRIAESCAQRGANIVVFPEYSIPPESLPELAAVAKRTGMCIVAGTHRVRPDRDRSIYEGLSLPLQSLIAGSACAPVLMPDGTTRVVSKSRASKWDSDLAIPSDIPTPLRVSVAGQNLVMAVLVCVDSLHPDVLGKLWGDKDNLPSLVVCPSFSPTTEPFRSLGVLTSYNEALFAFANSAAFGGTTFAIPAPWQAPSAAAALASDIVPRDAEAVLEVDIDPSRFSAKRGSTDTKSGCSACRSLPIVFEASATWLPRYDSLRREMAEWLKSPSTKDAQEWLDIYLTEEAAGLPVLVGKSVKHLRHALLPFYSGDPLTVQDATELVVLPKEISSTRITWARDVRDAIRLVTEALTTGSMDQFETMTGCLRNLKLRESTLPFVAPTSTPYATPEVAPPAGFNGDQLLLESFQDRGSTIDRMKGFLGAEPIRAIVITGAVGVGKTDLVNTTIRKVLADWEILRVPIPPGATFARVLADIAYRVGLALDQDSLAGVTQNVFKGKIRAVLGKFFSQPKRVLLLDDLYLVLKTKNARDFAQMDSFFEEVSTPPKFAGGRVFIVSSLHPPDRWLVHSGVAHLHVAPLEEKYVGRVVEYHMRRVGLTKGEEVPVAPRELLDIVGGHPLSAKLAVEAMRGRSVEELKNAVARSEVTGHVARELLRELLKMVPLTPGEKEAMVRLSVFRLPTEYNMLSKCGVAADALAALKDRCVVGFDGRRVELHEAIRRHFYAQAAESPVLPAFHRAAASYYSQLYESSKHTGHTDPTVIAELAHHLTMAGDIDAAVDFRLMVVEEIKPMARQLYKDYRHYARALELYKLVAEVVPDDVQVSAYIGRCYARLDRWQDSDTAFNRAIEIASKAGRPVWWIYRDWGHIKARFDLYPEAEKLLETAARTNQSDPSIKATLAYIRWHQGDREAACKLFEEALGLNTYHQYTLTYYPKLLHAMGEHEWANALSERLAAIESDATHVVPGEFDIDADYDDL